MSGASLAELVLLSPTFDTLWTDVGNHAYGKRRAHRLYSACIVYPSQPHTSAR